MRVVGLSWLCAGVVSAFLLSGCDVVSLAGSVAGAAVDVTGAVVSTGVKATGAVVGAVLPD
ncbi:hypothetical protein JJB74_14690 [Noviherbaspirillum sp. DKR-6]|uniref:Lipoprotein n=1 Tax=Noviherbaspirillum pedocola TaxID=2801341 RepID=A0A934W8I5_9BURK|nr:hypothetical protein [Noviherbaspirillum pedocola]